jgi:hypothetical protein
MPARALGPLQRSAGRSGPAGKCSHFKLEFLILVRGKWRNWGWLWPTHPQATFAAEILATRKLAVKLCRFSLILFMRESVVGTKSNAPYFFDQIGGNLRGLWTAHSTTTRQIIRFKDVLLRLDGALLMAWMPPPTGIVMCHCDVVRALQSRHRPYPERPHATLRSRPRSRCRSRQGWVIWPPNALFLLKIPRSNAHSLYYSCQN